MNVVRPVSRYSTLWAVIFGSMVIGLSAWVGSHYRKFDEQAVQTSRQHLEHIDALVATVEGRQAGAIEELHRIEAACTAGRK